MIIILNYEPSEKYTDDYLEHIITVNNKFKERPVKMGIKFIFIFLKRLENIRIFNSDNELLHWLKFIEFKDMEVINLMNSVNPHTKKAKEELDRINAEREEKRIAEIYENGLLDQRLAYTYGVDTGRAEGKTAGKIEGKIEEKKSVAKKLLSKNVDINIILDATGLTQNDLERLKEAI